MRIPLFLPIAEPETLLGLDKEKASTDASSGPDELKTSTEAKTDSKKYKSKTKVSKPKLLDTPEMMKLGRNLADAIFLFSEHRHDAIESIPNENSKLMYQWIKWKAGRAFSEIATAKQQLKLANEFIWVMFAPKLYAPTVAVAFESETPFSHDIIGLTTSYLDPEGAAPFTKDSAQFVQTIIQQIGPTIEAALESGTPLTPDIIGLTISYLNPKDEITITKETVKFIQQILPQPDEKLSGFAMQAVITSAVTTSQVIVKWMMESLRFKRTEENEERNYWRWMKGENFSGHKIDHIDKQCFAEETSLRRFSLLERQHGISNNSSGSPALDSPFSINEEQWTLLTLAIQFRCLEAVKLLIACGADPFVSTKIILSDQTEFKVVINALGSRQLYFLKKKASPDTDAIPQTTTPLELAQFLRDKAPTDHVRFSILNEIQNAVKNSLIHKFNEIMSQKGPYSMEQRDIVCKYISFLFREKVRFHEENMRIFELSNKLNSEKMPQTSADENDSCQNTVKQYLIKEYLKATICLLDENIEIPMDELLLKNISQAVHDANSITFDKDLQEEITELISLVEKRLPALITKVTRPHL